jgi:hypothetical protein
MTGGLTVENRTEPAATYKIGNATVRIHAGKMTKEERQQAFEQASQKMRREMERGRKKVESA